MTIACYYISNNLSLSLDITLSNILRYVGGKCDTSPLLSSTYKAYVTKKYVINIEGMCCPLPPPPFLPWETKWFNPALLISSSFDSNPYSILSLLLLHLFYLCLSILFQHPISLQCLRYYYPSPPSPSLPSPPFSPSY